jgi:hypothetical protein
MRAICQPGMPPSAMTRTGGGWRCDAAAFTGRWHPHGGRGGGGGEGQHGPGQCSHSGEDAAEVIHGALLAGGGGSGEELSQGPAVQAPGCCSDRLVSLSGVRLHRHISVGRVELPWDRLGRWLGTAVDLRRAWWWNGHKPQARAAWGQKPGGGL